MRLQNILPHYTRRQWWAVIILFFAYLVAEQIGIRAETAPAVIFPAAGIALAVLTLEGLALWPAVTLALIVGYLGVGEHLIPMLVLTLANTFSPLAGAYLLKQVGFNSYFRRLRDMITFFLVVGATSLIVPALGYIAVSADTHFYGVAFSALQNPAAWWLGIVTSNIAVAPLIMRWGIKPRLSRTKWEVAELVVAFGLFFVALFELTWTSYTQIFGVSLVYIILIPLFWLALRSGPRFLSVMLFFLFAVAYTGIFWGAAAGAGNIGEQLFQTEILFDILAVIFYIVVSIEEERKEALRAVSSQIGRLEHVLGEIEGENQAKTNFLAVLAHELRNPLAPVVSSIELLRVSEWVAPEGLPALDVMEGSVKVIRRHLDDLLDISRITQNKMSIKKELFHVGFAVRRALKVLEKRIEAEHQNISVNLPNVPLIIDADPVRIEQIFTNLLVNASKFTPPGGTVSVNVRATGGMAEIRVRDSGIGIDPSMLQRIFDPFVQLGQEQEGLGVGLALTRRLVEVHGGTIEARSDGKGQGSEFIVRLPLTVSTRISPAEMREEPSLGTQPHLRRRILVVDDNATAARAVGALLEHDGHAVEYAGSGAEARDKANSFRPDAAILDIGLPDMSGYDLARDLRAQGDFRGRLIALTGYGQEEDKRRARHSGFDVHLTKPVALRDLRAALTL